MNSPLFFFFFLAKTPIAPEEKGSLKLFFNHILQIGYSARSLLITLYADTAFIFLLVELMFSYYFHMLFFVKTQIVFPVTQLPSLP